MRCLFLAPLKPPDHPVPSGDRLIARQFRALLKGLGYQADLVSSLQTRCATPESLPAIITAAGTELARCLAAEAKASDRARIVFTYHNYYRGPDLIGPGLAQALGLPYVIAESSRAPRRALGEWAEVHRLAEKASDAADMIIAPTAHDMEMLEKLRTPAQTVMQLKPFLDLADWPLANEQRPPRAPGPVRLLTIAMMREGNKVQSYIALSAILRQLVALDWSLDIVGDGDGRPEIESHFSAFGQRVRFHGAIDDRARMGAFLQAADIFVWPAIEEPIGMVFLEAQAHGLPCIAFGYRGVPDVIENGAGGFVIAPGHESEFVGRLADMIRNPATATALGLAARRNFSARHGMVAARRTVAQAFKAAGFPLPPDA